MNYSTNSNLPFKCSSVLLNLVSFYKMSLWTCHRPIWWVILLKYLISNTIEFFYRVIICYCLTQTKRQKRFLVRKFNKLAFKLNRFRYVLLVVPDGGYDGTLVVCPVIDAIGVFCLVNGNTNAWTW